jgi:hypothetical protein
MLVVAVNKQGLFFDRIEQYLDTETGARVRELKFTDIQTCATSFNAETLPISRREEAWAPLFAAESRNEVAFVPHPEYVFDGLIGGMAAYSRITGLMPSHRFDRDRLTEFQQEILEPLYAAADAIDRKACSSPVVNADKPLRRILEREYERLNCSIWRLHFDLGVLENQDDTVAQWERKIGEVLFPREEPEGEVFELHIT